MDKEQKEKKQSEITHSAIQKQESEPSRGFLKFSVPRYFRELSIVIIGVFVTLFITNAINNYNRQKEIKEILKLVKTELEENLEDLGLVQERWEGEQHIFWLIRENLNNLEQIPADTLNKYRPVVGRLYGFKTKSDSYELLQNSMLMQYIKDKDMLRSLSKTYEEFRAIDRQLSNYTTQKLSIFLEPFTSAMGEKEMEKLTNEDPYDLFNYVSSKEGFRKFIFIGSTIVSPPSIFDDCKENTSKTIQMLEQKGY